MHTKVLRCCFGAALLAGCAAPSGSEPAAATAPMVDSLNQPLASITADIVRKNAAMDEAMHLVARLEVQPNELIEFYEPAPGVILLSGAGRPTTPMAMDPAVVDTDDYRALWRSLAHGADMPVALDEAITRREERIEARIRRAAELGATIDPSAVRERVGGLSSPPERADSIQPPDETVGGATKAQAASWCNTSWFSNKPSGYSPYALGACPNQEWKQCFDNVTGSCCFSHDDIETLWTGVCPSLGEVWFGADADEGWVTEGVWAVPQDTARWKKASDPGCDEFPFTNDCVYIRIDVTNAFNKIYNFRYIVSED